MLRTNGLILIIFAVSILTGVRNSTAGIFQEKLFLMKDSHLSVNYRHTVFQVPSVPVGQATDAKPFLKSLLIPGWGQYSQGRNNSALIYISLEALFWGGMFSFQSYGGWLENDYKGYAVSHAGIEPVGKNHDYFVDIGNYDDMDEYNRIQQLERDWDALYLDDTYYWQWDNSSNRTTFEDLRIKSDLYKNSTIYFAGAILVNHLISAIDAARYTRTKDNLNAGVTFNQQGNSMLTIIKGF